MFTIQILYLSSSPSKCLFMWNSVVQKLYIATRRVILTVLRLFTIQLDDWERCEKKSNDTYKNKQHTRKYVDLRDVKKRKRGVLKSTMEEKNIQMKLLWKLTGKKSPWEWKIVTNNADLLWLLSIARTCIRAEQRWWAAGACDRLGERQRPVDWCALRGILVITLASCHVELL